ncbi:MAG: flavin reductase [Colwellia sp.]|nr:flavin reductase [Colwellia sp.]
MFINGISIILTGTNDDYKGMAIAWVSQVEKEHLIVSVPKGAQATNLLLERKMFSVNELGLGQENLALQFGGKNCHRDLISIIPQIKGTEHNLPILLNCCSSSICSVQSLGEINEQVVITAKIISTTKGIDMPSLVFNKATYFGDMEKEH